RPATILVKALIWSSLRKTVDDYSDPVFHGAAGHDRTPRFDHAWISVCVAGPVVPGHNYANWKRPAGALLKCGSWEPCRRATRSGGSFSMQEAGVTTRK